MKRKILFSIMFALFVFLITYVVVKVGMTNTNAVGYAYTAALFSGVGFWAGLISANSIDGNDKNFKF